MKKILVGILAVLFCGCSGNVENDLNPGHVTKIGEIDRGTGENVELYRYTLENQTYIIAVKGQAVAITPHVGF
jgi:hypothetical protein